MKELFDEHGIEPPIHFSEHLIGEGQKMFDHAAKLNWEGIVSKRVDAPYKSERGEACVKVKTVQRGKFPVVGFVADPSGWLRFISASEKAQDLVYMGKVGTGWNRATSAQIRKSLDAVITPKQKLTRPIRKPKATRVEPWFFADIEYRDITSEGCCGQARSKVSRKPIVRNFSALIFSIPIRSLRTKQSRMPNSYSTPLFLPDA